MNKLYSLFFVLGISLSANAQIIFDIPGASATYITGINLYTDICGYAEFPDGTTKGFVKISNDTIMLNYLGNTWAGGINDNGQVVGRYNSSGASFDYHVFIYDIGAETYTVITDLDGYELTSPNDINNEGWISGDLKDAAQRRIFTWHPSQGTATNFVMVGTEVMPTYGGHYINEEGKITAFYLDGGSYISCRYQDNEFSDYVDIPDPLYNSHKTKFMGGNESKTLISFFASRTAYIYDNETQEVGQNWLIPVAMETYAMDINEEDYMAGYFLDENYVVHGFFQGRAKIDFLPSQNGWNFVNSYEDCWAPAHYANISYTFDPYWTEQGVANYFPANDTGYAYPAVSFDPWHEFVKACSENECYDFDPLVNYSEQDPNAFKIWKDNRADQFLGDCWGMCANALMVWDSLQLLEQHYPSTNGLFENNPAASLDSLTYDTDVVPPCRISQIKQYQKQEWAKVQEGFHSTLLEFYPRVYSSLRDPGESTQIISMRLQGVAVHGVHAVVPYALDRDPDDINKYRIHIYDPNEPLNDDRFIDVEFNGFNAQYRYDFSGTYTNYDTEGLEIGPYEYIFTEPFEIFQSAAPNLVRDEDVLVSFPNRPDIHVQGITGGSADIAGNAFTDDLEGGETIFTRTGLNQKPYLFRLSSATFNATATTIDGQPFYASSHGEHGTVSYIRNNPEIGETDDVISAGNVFSYVNNGTEPMEVTGWILTSDETNTYQYFCDNMSIAPGQTIGLEIVDPTHVMITSNGAATSYDVRIRIFSEESGFWETTSPAVAIGAEVTQLIVPHLVDDTFNGVTIETDADSDGDFESSDELDNEGMPDMMLSETQISLPEVSAGGTFNVSNVGAGNLNWTFVSVPTWVAITEGATGVNHGPVTFTAEDNTGLTRQDYLIVEASAPANDQDSVLVIQLGSNGVNDLELAALISIQPNPAMDRLQFVRHDILGGSALQYEIFDATGRVVKKGNFTSTRENIDVAEWERGVYTVRFISNGRILTKRVVLV